MTKYIFVTGGVVSSLGKGITAASLGRLLVNRGYRVTIQKLDPYINYDPGTMSPYQHGEVFVTEDGAETDLDLGHYERFVDTDMTGENNVTTGKIYWKVLTSEREGYYQGKTVQVIPHVTDEIKRRIRIVSRGGAYDVVIVEVGGTVGDIEGLPFLEAIRQMKKELGPDNVFYLHVTLVPHLSSTEELKTKPTQHSVKELRSIGIKPDLIVCRSERPLGQELKEKIALFADLEPEQVIENLDTESIYEVPALMQKNGLDRLVGNKLKLNAPSFLESKWKEMMMRKQAVQGEHIKIGIVGKYVALEDAYISIKEALTHAGIFHLVKIKTIMIDAEKNSGLDNIDGLIVPGGFGIRGIEGKIKAIQWARENEVPFLGLCLGMHCAVIEFARNVAGLDANSTEFEPDTPDPVIHLLPGQEGANLGGTLRLGSYPCSISHGSLAAQAYSSTKIHERHRHRYEFNNDYKEALENYGMAFTGIYPGQDLVEIAELPEHPWFLATQFHPEFKSRPLRPHPLFCSFIESIIRTGG